MHIGIISDLHIGAKARSADLRPNEAVRPGHKRYLDQFADFARQQAQPCDFLVVSGDIANTACASEYFHAAEVIKEVAACLGVPNGQTIFIPGNHDVSWTLQKLGQSSTTAAPPPPASTTARDRSVQFWREQRFLPVQRILSPSLDSSRTVESLFEPPYFVTHEFPGAIFVRINSAYSCDHDVSPSHGRIHAETISGLTQALTPRLASGDERPVIAVVHHHILPTDEPDPYWTDVSAAQGSEAFINAAWRLKIDLVIHGHKHWPRFRVQSSPNDGLFAVLGAGSFSAEIDAQVQGKVFNNFHVVEIAGRDQDANLRGWVNTWSYVTQKSWHSPTDAILPPRQPFGHYRSNTDLNTQITNALTALVGTNQVPVTDVLSALPNHEYVERTRFDNALLHLCPTLGMRLTLDRLTGVEFVHR